MDPQAEPEPPLVAITGPTATGKTATAVLVARAIGGEVVSVDSMAVYRGMDVGTAKPSEAERAAVLFHLIDVVSPDEPFNVSRYRDLAEAVLQDIRARGRRAVLAGGTGLYLRVLLEGFGLTSSPPDTALRERLNREADERGSPALHARLRALDPAAAERIHPNDRVRTIRALEVCLTSGVPITTLQARDAAQRSARPARKFALTAERDELYRRIDERVDAMIHAGLEQEVRRLLDAGYSPELPPMRSLGYKEMTAYLRGETDMETAVEGVKRETRRFAKRQLTWFRADPELTWIDVGGRSPADVAAEILDRLAA